MVNQAIRNNPDKFPSGYVIELTNSEKEYVVKNFDHLETLKFSHATVKGFTEQGLYMLATILKSPMATATTIAIIDTFTKLRKLARTIDKVNADAKEQGILPDKATEGKIQAAMNEVFADNLPLKLRKLRNDNRDYQIFSSFLIIIPCRQTSHPLSVALVRLLNGHWGGCRM